MTRTKQKARRGRGRGRIDKRRRASTGNMGRGRRPTAEQLDFEMELLRAQREGREDDFRKEHAEKRREKRKQTLDDEMDEYFKARDAVEDGDEKEDDGKPAAGAAEKPDAHPSAEASKADEKGK